MTKETQRGKLPRSVRKHLRLQKARLRRGLPPAQAKRAIDQLVRSVSR